MSSILQVIHCSSDWICPSVLQFNQLYDRGYLGPSSGMAALDNLCACSPGNMIAEGQQLLTKNWLHLLIHCLMLCLCSHSPYAAWTHKCSSQELLVCLQAEESTRTWVSPRLRLEATFCQRLGTGLLQCYSGLCMPFSTPQCTPQCTCRT